MAAKRKPGGSKHANNVRHRRAKPPWGRLLKGKPIERYGYLLNNKKIDVTDLARLLQHIKMLQLLKYYEIPGDVPTYPIKGFASASWVPWYELALAIASDIDDNLKIVDGSPSTNAVARCRWIHADDFR